MGGVSSVYIRPVASATCANDQPRVSESMTEAGSQIVQWQLQEGNPGGGVLEMKIVSEDREAEMGRTIQFLAEENVRLRQMNDAMKLQLGDVNDTVLIQPDFFTETEEDKVKRLEKTLILEREEKWAAIANAEVCRVNLINCQILLTQEENTRKMLESELNSAKERFKEDEIKRLKADCAQVAIERSPDLGCDLQTFRNQMQQLREARHKVISAKSEEMIKLREDLANERALRERLDRKLNNLMPPNPNEICNEHFQEIESLGNQLKTARDENVHLNESLVRLRLERTQFSVKCLQLENDLSEAQRKNERLGRDYCDLERENERIGLKLRDVGDTQQLSRGDFESEKEDMLKQMVALKDIARISRQMLAIRQNQVDDLKAKLNVIEETMNRSPDGGELKAEYEKQLENIKTLKELYEERVNLMEAERSKLLEKISSDSKAMEDLKSELSDLSIKYEMAAEEADQERQKNIALDAELSGCAAQSQSWQRELTRINSLLTQMLLGPSPETPEHLDRLVELLQQNHELIAQITNCEDCNDVAAALPKLLLDLITQVEDGEKREMITMEVSMTDSTDTISEQSGALPIVSYKNAKVFKEPEIENQEDGMLDYVMPASKVNPAVQEIVTNLPKVWKVLTELLSHHSLVERQPGEPTGQERTCYKRIETPNGPRSVISVSNTFIRLKELILEKKSLTQEVCRLRHLNSHLETRLEDQEKRLSSVQSELHKTWGVVGRMRAQHQQLHNHEKILRYELQEKRIMLSELREELEHCKDKWERARRKNNESEAECRKLRKEFAARKFEDLGLNASRDSGESGFSDDQCDADRSSTPSPIDFKARSEPDAQSSSTEAGNYLPVEELPDGRNLVEEMNTTSAQWAQIVEEAGNSEGNVQPGAVANLALNEELRVNISPLEVQLAPVEEEPAEGAVLTDVMAVAEEYVVESEQDRARAARALRLQRLEEQCALLVRKVDITTHKSNFLSNRLEELHDHYGGGSSTQEQGSECDARDVTSVACVAVEAKAPPIRPPLPPGPEKRLVVETSANPSELEDEPYGTEYVAVDASTPSVEYIPEDIKPLPTPPPLPAEPHQLTLDERLAARDERLLRLEADCSSLCGKVGKTVNRGIELSAKLTEIHEGCVNTENRIAAASSSNQTETEEERAVEESDAIDLSTPSAEYIPEDIKPPPTPPPLPAEPQQLTLDERLAARDERLLRLEADCSSLCGKVGKTVNRGIELSAKLTEIHEGCVNTENQLAAASSSNQTETEEERAVEESDAMDLCTPSAEYIPEDMKPPPTPPPLPAEPQQLTLDERLAARDERLRRLEADCSSLCGRVGKTVNRGIELSAKLTEIHEGCVNTENQFTAASSSNQTELEDEQAVEDCDAIDLSTPSVEYIPEATKPPPTPPPLPAEPHQLTLDERLAARDERLRRLEVDCSSLCGKVGKTVNRGIELSARLTEIHEGCVNTENQLAAASPSNQTELDDEQAVDDCDAIDLSTPSVEYSPEATKPPPTPLLLPAEPPQLTLDERLAARDERLRRLEADCSSLCGKVGKTVNRGIELSAKLTQIHEGCVNTENQLAAASPSNQTELKDEQAVVECDAIDLSTPSVEYIPEDIKPPPTPPPLPAELYQLTLDERLAARDERLRRLEAECSSLCGKVGNTVNRGIELSAKLTEIHEGCINTENRIAASSSSRQTETKDESVVDSAPQPETEPDQ